MAAFEYQALNAKGKTVKGVTNGDHAKQVRAELRAGGLMPLEVTLVSQNDETKFQGKLQGRDGQTRKIKIKSNQLSLLTRQMATLLESGMTIEETLATLIKQTETHKVKSVISDIRSLVTEGYSLSDAIALYPASFPEIYKASVSAGEESGTLDKVLERLADYLEESHVMQQKITQAVVYPIFLFFACSMILILMIVLVVPKVVKVYQDTGQELPWLTTAVISISDLLANYGLHIAVVMLIVGFGLRALFKKSGPRFWLHTQYLNLVGVRKMVQNIDTARMARTLSIMVGSGVSILPSMRASEGVMKNEVLRKDLQGATEEVAQGVAIGRALERSGHFPPLLVHMVASGENSGRLDHMLEKVATATENEMQTRISMLVSLLGPIMILVMGSLVCAIVMAILLPIFNLDQMLDF